jgi:hypothetical protein
MAVTTRKWHAALDKVAADARAKFPDHTGKLDQLDAALATAAMCLDDMNDYPPYILPTN